MHINDVIRDIFWISEVFWKPNFHIQTIWHSDNFPFPNDNICSDVMSSTNPMHYSGWEVGAQYWNIQFKNFLNFPCYIVKKEIPKNVTNSFQLSRPQNRTNNSKSSETAEKHIRNAKCPFYITKNRSFRLVLKPFLWKIFFFYGKT